MKTNIQNIVEGKKLLFTNKQIQKEINLWLLEIKSENIKPHFSFLLDCELPEQRDILGILLSIPLYLKEKNLKMDLITHRQI